MNNRRYGTQVVSGVTPGKGGQDVEGVLSTDTFHDAVGQTGANTAMVFVPPAFAELILEAADAGIATIIVITEGIPAHDGCACSPICSASTACGSSAQPPGRPVARQGERGDHPGSVLP